MGRGFPRIGGFSRISQDVSAYIRRICVDSCPILAYSASFSRRSGSKVMVFPGSYTAVKLDGFRAWPLEAERRIFSGHWHILAAVSAVMMILLVEDRLNVRGWMRRVLGWGFLLGGNLAFTMATFCEFLPREANRDWTTLYWIWPQVSF